MRTTHTAGGRQRDVVVTGAGGGLGAAACDRLLAAGWRVFAADVVAPPERPGLVPLTIDVTDDGSVQAVAKEVAATSSGLAGVVHFAGILAVGPLLDLEPAVLQRVLDVNVLGTHRVNRALVPLVRAGRGRIVLISSETGVQSGAPFNGAYAMSKHAVEAYGDSLRRELMFLDVPVVKVQPGPFRTAMVESVVAEFERAAERSELFADLLRAALRRLPAEQAHARDPAELAEVVERALTEPRWRAAYLVHPDRSRMLLDRLPPRVADRVLRLGLRALQRQGRRGRP